MMCIDAIERLNEFIDGELSAAPHCELENHLQGCEACRQEWQALSLLIHQAAELPEQQEPTRDLWPHIAARVSSNAEQVVPFRHGRPKRLSLWLGVAAVLLLSLALGMMMHHSLVSSPARTAEMQPNPKAQAAAVQAAYLSVDQDLATTRTQLQKLLEERRENISPATMAVVSENLAIIEDSIFRISNALREEPANPELHRMLLAACRSELRLLQQATTMPTRSHEG